MHTTSRREDRRYRTGAYRLARTPYHPSSGPRGWVRTRDWPVLNLPGHAAGMAGLARGPDRHPATPSRPHSHVARHLGSAHFALARKAATLPGYRAR
jgi:hypothetical protein